MGRGDRRYERCLQNVDLVGLHKHWGFKEEEEVEDVS
jgi:hypothetical protein